MRFWFGLFADHELPDDQQCRRSPATPAGAGVPRSVVPVLLSCRLQFAELNRETSVATDMNGTQVVLLDQPPSALEFSQLVAMSRPVVFKSDPTVPDTSRWTVEYLTQKLGDQAVSVSVTPDG